MGAFLQRLTPINGGVKGGQSPPYGLNNHPIGNNCVLKNNDNAAANIEA